MSKIFMVILVLTIFPLILNDNVPTIAILPFENLTGNTESEWIGRGFSESLSSGLLDIPDLILVERYKLNEVLEEISISQTGLIDSKSSQEAGKLLGADYLTLGSYQIMDETMRVNCRIIEVESGAVINSVKLTNEYENLFALQDSLISTLLIGLGKSELIKTKKKIIELETNDLEAYEYAIKGEIELDRGAFKPAADYFEKALNVDDDYQRARDGINYAYYPMMVGNFWKYNTTMSGNVYLDQVKSSLESRITGTEIIEGKSYIIIENEVILDKENLIAQIPNTKFKYYFYYCDEGIALYKLEDAFGSHKIVGDSLFYKLPIKKGDKWNIITSYSGSKIVTEHYVDNIEETVNVPAGEFDCIKLIAKTKMHTPYQTETVGIQRLNKGVGLIKSESTTVVYVNDTKSESFHVNELIEYHLKKYTSINKM
jgi:TolB-like protein